MQIFNGILRITCLFLATHLTNAQESVNFFRSTAKNEKYETGVPFPAGMAGPVYTPEMGFAIKGTVAVTFKTKRNNEYLQHSSVIVNSEVNPKGSLRLSSEAELHFLDDLIFTTMAVDYRNMDDHYWGIGTDHANTVEQGELTTAYKRKSLVLHPSLMLRTFKNLYLGFSFESNQFKAENISPLMNEDPDILTYGTDIRTAGVGVRTFYDRRNRLNPVKKGFMFDIVFLNFAKALSGSDHSTYQRLYFDYRHHIPVIREGSLINLQLKGMTTFGEVPWNTLAVPQGIKGFHEGKYRDKNSVGLIAEYRHFLNPDGISRHGLFYWIGGATVFSKISEADTFIFSSGGGYLYHFQPNILLKAELFFGTENVGFSFGLNETF